MQPQKGLSSRDSFTVCQEADIFSHIRSPKQPLKIREEFPVLDTLEREQEENKRLMLEQPVLRPIYFLGKAGKGVAIFILFPIHFFLFRTPKWVITKMIPLVFQASSKLTLKVKEALTKGVQEVVQRLQVMSRLQEPLKAFAKVLKSLFKETVHYLKSPFIAVLKKAEDGFKIVVKIFNQAEHFVAAFNKLVKKAADRAIRSEKLKRNEALFRFKGLFQERVKDPLKKSVANLSIKWNTFLKEAKNQLIKQQNNIEKALLKKEQLKKSIKLKIVKALKPIQAASETVKKEWVEVKNHLKEIVAPKVEAALWGAQKAVQVFNPAFAGLNGLMQTARQKGGRFIARDAKVAQFVKTFGALSKKVFQKMALHDAILRSFERLFKDASSFAKGTFLKAKEKLKEKEIKQKVKQKAEVFINFLASMMRGLSHYVMMIFRKIMRFFSLFFKWCRIMAKFSYYLGQEILQELQTI